MQDKNQSLFLDFLGGPQPFSHLPRLDLTSYAEELSYATRMKTFQSFAKFLTPQLGQKRFIYLGNGDFHHLSYLLLKNTSLPKIHLVLFDNHPDNMFYPLGIHCGSWVYHAARLPHVEHVSIIGLTSNDLDGANVWQNHYAPIRSGKIHYYAFKKTGRIVKFLSKGNIHNWQDNLNHLPQAVSALVQEIALPVYLSIDKDVCLKKELPTNWDQGILSSSLLLQCVKEIMPKVAALDFTGDPSHYRSRNRLKHFLRSLDDDGDNGAEGPTQGRELHLNFEQELWQIFSGL